MAAFLERLLPMTLGLLSLVIATTSAPAITDRVPENVDEWESLWTEVLDGQC